MATIASAASATASITPGASGWWLRDPLDSSRNVQVFVGDEALERVTDEPQDVLRPLGRTTAVVVSGGIIRSPEFDITFSCPTRANRVAINLLRTSLRTLLLVSPYGHGMYVRLGQARQRQVLMGGTRTVDTLAYSAVVVDAP